MNFLFQICLLISVFVAASAVEIPESETINIEIEHNLQGSFTTRARYTVPLRSGSGKQSPDLNNTIVNDEDLAAFKKLLVTDGYYRIRVKNSRKDANPNYYATAVLPACKLQSSGFKEDISIHLDRHSNVVGISYSSPIIALPRPCDPTLVKTLVTFHTRIKHVDTLQAQSLPVQTLGAKPPTLQNVKLDIDKDAPGAAQPQQSFLRKYWYIVLIMIVYMFLGKEEPKGKEGKKE